MSAIIKNEIKYFNAYSINLDAADKAYTELQDSDLPSSFRATLNYALKGMHFTEILKQCTDSIEGAEMTLALVDSSFPGIGTINRVIQINQQKCEELNATIKHYGGVDPFAIQSVVNAILGIQKRCVASCLAEQDDVSGLSTKEKTQCYEFLKRTQLLVSDQEWFSEDGKEINGQTASEYFSQYLRENPNVTKLIIGCGIGVRTQTSSCFERMPDHNLDNAATLSLDAMDGSDIIGDMHDPELFKNVPNDYFERIEDHTKGESINTPGMPLPNTFATLFRVLQPGGSLVFEWIADPKHLQTLQDSGFLVTTYEDDSTVIATKPNE